MYNTVQYSIVQCTQCSTCVFFVLWDLVMTLTFQLNYECPHYVWLRSAPCTHWCSAYSSCVLTNIKSINMSLLNLNDQRSVCVRAQIYWWYWFVDFNGNYQLNCYWLDKTSSTFNSHATTHFTSQKALINCNFLHSDNLHLISGRSHCDCEFDYQIRRIN